MNLVPSSYSPSRTDQLPSVSPPTQQHYLRDATLTHRSSPISPLRLDHINSSHTPSTYCSLQARPSVPRSTRISSTGRKLKTLSQKNSSPGEPFVQQPSRQQRSRQQPQHSRQQPQRSQQRPSRQQPARKCGASGQKIERRIWERVRADILPNLWFNSKESGA